MDMLNDINRQIIIDSKKIKKRLKGYTEVLYSRDEVSKIFSKSVSVYKKI